MSNNPIYIGGVSYSGKTQLRLLLSRHSNIIITRRTYLWRKFYQKFGSLAQKENLERCLAEILDLKDVQRLNPDPDRIRLEFWQGETSYSNLFSLIHKHYAEELGKSRWGVQIGKVEGDADLILSAESNAQIIQVVRNPLDRTEEKVSSSSWRKLSVGRETRFWSESSKLAERNIKKYPNNYLIVKWENLLEDVDGTLRIVCEFLGEGYQPSILKSEGLEETHLGKYQDASTTRSHLTIKESANSPKLSKEERFFIHKYTQSEMAYLGYEEKKPFLNISEKLKFTIFHYPVFLLGSYLWGSLFSPKIFQFFSIDSGYGE